MAKRAYVGLCNTRNTASNLQIAGTHGSVMNTVPRDLIRPYLALGAKLIVITLIETQTDLRSQGRIVFHTSYGLLWNFR